MSCGLVHSDVKQTCGGDDVRSASFRGQYGARSGDGARHSIPPRSQEQGAGPESTRGRQGHYCRGVLRFGYEQHGRQCLAGILLSQIVHVGGLAFEHHPPAQEDGLLELADRSFA